MEFLEITDPAAHPQPEISRLKPVVRGNRYQGGLFPTADRLRGQSFGANIVPQLGRAVSSNARPNKGRDKSFPAGGAVQHTSLERSYGAAQGTSRRVELLHRTTVRPRRLPNWQRIPALSETTRMQKQVPGRSDERATRSRASASAAMRVLAALSINCRALVAGNIGEYHCDCRWITCSLVSKA